MARAKMACAKVSLRQSVPAPKCLAPSRPRQVGRAKSAAPNCPRPSTPALLVFTQRSPLSSPFFFLRLVARRSRRAAPPRKCQMSRYNLTVIFV
ncbi:hypothetical protein Zmor_020675 [Zophobas morio]|uniref:Uncharacterized protein n=1 Tax=Zophobas morio TaxID=2755281 RepID=A0AA38MA81_9CUCU|nr:hypothetical protein Zmor_020675 [Zophobas morio]